MDCLSAHSIIEMFLKECFVYLGGRWLRSLEVNFISNYNPQVHFIGNLLLLSKCETL